MVGPTATLTDLLTYSMQQSPSWEANRISVSQEIPRILWDPKVHYCIHKCLPTVPTLTQVHPVRAPISHCLKIHLTIYACFPSGLFPSGFLTKTLYMPLLSPIRSICPPISFFSILSPEQYWVRSTDH